MKLVWKLFFSYLLVVLVGAGVIVLSTAYTAPTEFTHQMMNNNAMGMGQGHRQRTGQTRLIEELDAQFRQSVNTALVRSSLFASLIAVGMSFLISQRITRPIRLLNQASHQIASGSYTTPIAPSSNDELGELTTSFNQMATTLAQTETMRQQLLADVTHELKTPLASLNAYLEGLQDRVLAETPETYQQMQQEVRRLQRLVQDLQQLSRAEAGQLHLKQDTCEATQLLNAAVEWLSPQFEEKNIALTTHFPPSPAYFAGDADRMSQVILNLLSNALHYTPSGGQVHLNLTPQDSLLHFSVQDTGIGLTPEALSLIFMRFYRVDKSRSRESGGSGLGLTIAKHLVEAHGGKIWAESDGLNRGSTFHFTLPIRQENFSKT